jgi:hypothetical protein
VGNLTGRGAPVNPNRDWTLILPDGTRRDPSWARVTPGRPRESLELAGTDQSPAAALRARWLHEAADADLRAAMQGGLEEANVSTSRGARVHELLRLHAIDGRSWELRPGQVLHLGTHPANDVVVGDDAGEIQAQVRWSSAERAPLLSARRGWRAVRLDDRPVLGAVPLRSGHFIEAAGERFRVEMVRGALLDLPELEAIDLLCPPPPQEDDGGSFPDRTWLSSVLKGLEAAKRTGVLRLVVDAQTAMIAFDRGRVVDAACGDLVGLAALEQVRVGTSGAWRFSPQQVVRPGPLDVSIGEFLRLGYWELARRRAIRTTDARTPA